MSSYSESSYSFLSRWKSFRPNLCRDCRAECCSLPVEVTVDDLIRLELLQEDDRHLPAKKIASMLSRQKVLQQFRVKTQKFTLAQKPNYECIFLDKQKKCTVYEKRPEVCRKFPTELGPRLGFCPHRPLSQRGP